MAWDRALWVDVTVSEGWSRRGLGEGDADVDRDSSGRSGMQLVLQELIELEAAGAIGAAAMSAPLAD